MPPPPLFFVSVASKAVTDVDLVVGLISVASKELASPRFRLTRRSAVSVADKGLRDRLNVETSAGLNVTEFEKRS